MHHDPGSNGGKAADGTPYNILFRRGAAKGFGLQQKSGKTRNVLH